MVILPAIDIKDGKCVRLYKGDFSTVENVADNALDTARAFYKAGARWIHMVDLDGAKDGTPRNSDIFIEVAEKSGLKVELGGGIRSMETVDHYLNSGISRVILGSAALSDPQLVKTAVAKYGDRIAVGIDAVDGFAAADGWLSTSRVSFLDLAVEMDKIGVKYIIYTDISTDGTLAGPNLTQQKQINDAVSCNIIASGGIRDMADLEALSALGIYGAICGKSVYKGTVDLASAVEVFENNRVELDDLFKKSELIPAIIQQYDTGEVLMLAYMNRRSLQISLESGYTCFFSRSRQTLWKKGETSGHVQKIVSVRADCDNDTLLVQVDQTGAACHTGSHNCFFKSIK